MGINFSRRAWLWNSVWSYDDPYFRQEDYTTILYKGRMKQKRYFRVKAWDKFSYPMQRALLKKYDVILTDHKTNLEFVRDLAKKFSIKGFQKAIDKFDHTMEQFDAAKNFKIFPDQSEIRNFAPERDYTPLTGKDKNISFWG